MLCPYTAFFLLTGTCRWSVLEDFTAHFPQGLFFFLVLPVYCYQPMSLHPHARVAQSCNPMEHSLPDSAHGLCQAWILEWGCHFLLHAPVFSALFFLCFCNLASDTFYTFLLLQLTLEQHGFELGMSIYTQVFFSKYSTARTGVGWICRCELHMQRTELWNLNICRFWCLAGSGSTPVLRALYF